MYVIDLIANISSIHF